MKWVCKDTNTLKFKSFITDSLTLVAEKDMIIKNQDTLIQAQRYIINSKDTIITTQAFDIKRLRKQRNISVLLNALLTTGLIIK
jgi:hypothetical protein